MAEKVKLISIIMLLFFGALIVSSCHNEDERKGAYYIISQNQSSVSITDPSESPPPPMVFYGKFNFIVLESGEILFFTKHCKFNVCEVGDGTRPPFLNLVPNDIRAIKIDTLRNFLENQYSGLDLPELTEDSQENYFSNSINYYTTVSSPGDTIRNEAVKIILNFMDEKKFKKYIIRRSTEEEIKVVGAIQNGSIYDPKNIRWEVGFDSGCE